MTTNVTVSWTLPTTRVSGNPIDPNNLAGVDVSLSADGGVNFALTDTIIPTDPQEVFFPDLVDGDYAVRLVVRLVSGQASAGVDTPFTLDTSVPNDVTDVTITLS